MSSALDLGLLLLTCILGGLPLAWTLRFRRAVQLQRAQAPTRPAWPPATLIVPCKGLDPGFIENIRALALQDYPELELIFTVATEDDPAHAALRDILSRLQEERPDQRVRLVVAGVVPGRAQKLNNQLAALSLLSSQSEVLVFMDSDVRPDPQFLRRLIAPLGEAGVGASTGFRWYHPPRPSFGSMLRSTWNAGALPFLVDAKRNFAWGGAMAMRRDLFERAGIADAWKHALSDDFPFTLGVRKLGMQLRFVPDCIAVSHEMSTLAETLEFTNRQSIISRVYFPPLWWAAASGHAIANLLTFYGMYRLVSWFMTGQVAHLAGVGCLFLVPMQMLNGWLLLGSVAGLLPSIANDLKARSWRYAMIAPAASILSLVNTFYSLTTRRITWRGVRYELRSPSETVVLDA